MLTDIVHRVIGMNLEGMAHGKIARDIVAGLSQLEIRAFADAHISRIRVQAEIINAFNTLGLLLSGVKDIIATPESEAIIIRLREFGCVIRIDINDRPQIESPFMLQPFGAITTGIMRFEVLPLIQTNENLVTYEALETLEDYFAQDGYDFFDQKFANIGFLPSGRAIVLDRGAALQDYKVPPLFLGSFASERELYEVEQDELYGDGQLFFEKCFIKRTSQKSLFWETRGTSVRTRPLQAPSLILRQP